MRSMTTTTSAHLATMGKEDLVVKIADKNRPATTTATGMTTTASSNSTRSKHSFRFPRFSLKSPQAASTTSTNTTKTTTATSTSTTTNTTTTSPKSSRPRLRSFPLLRLRGNNNTPLGETSETSALTTSVTPWRQAKAASSGSTSSSSSSNKDDFVMRCTKIMTVQSAPLEEAESDNIQATPTTGDVPHTMLSFQSQAAQSFSNDNPLSPSMFEEGQQQQEPFSCATAILQHSYLEMVCGGRQGGQIQDPNTTPSARSKRRMPDDPTVQDSIECVFASQLEEGLPLWADDDDDDDDDDDEMCDEEYRDEREHAYSLPRNSYEEEPINAPTEAELPSPAPLMQSRQKTRMPLPFVTKAMVPAKRRSHPSNNSIHNQNKHQPSSHHHRKLRFASDDSSTAVKPKRKKRYQMAKMVHVGTFDPRTNRLLDVAETDHNLMEEDPVVRVAACSIQSPPRKVGECFCHSHSVPIIPAEYWPQAPLLLRPTPGTGMSILGVRFSGKTEHFWQPFDGGWWLTPLYELAGKEAPELPLEMPAMCSQCCLLPINNGNEPIGKALVADFETPLFEGSLLLRLRHVDGGATNTDPALMEYNDNMGYFDGLNRRYQVVIRGKFKREMPMTDLVSGWVMDRPVGRLPPKWIMKGAIKVLSFFAPQLEVEMDCPRPKTMAPLGSTPQVLRVQDIGPQDELPPLDGLIDEPTNAKDCLLQTAFPGSTSLQRARGRKKAFDKLYAGRSREPKTKISSGSHETYYTFEFLQHLVNFQEFSVELGNLLGSIPLAPIFNGQPFPIMAMLKDGQQKLWSFDIWHEALVDGAKKHDASQQGQPVAEQ